MRCQRVSLRFTGASTDATQWAESLRAAPRFAPPAWRPAADVWEVSEAFVVRVELPGVSEEELEVLVHPNALVVKGERASGRPADEAACHVAEIRRGRFVFDLRLRTDVDPERAEGRLERGILTLRLPKGPRT